MQMMQAGLYERQKIDLQLLAPRIKCNFGLQLIAYQNQILIALKLNIAINESYRYLTIRMVSCMI